VWPPSGKNVLVYVDTDAEDAAPNGALVPKGTLDGA
jgi:hypothetical protein